MLGLGFEEFTNSSRQATANLRGLGRDLVILLFILSNNLRSTLEYRRSKLTFSSLTSSEADASAAGSVETASPAVSLNEYLAKDRKGHKCHPRLLDSFDRGLLDLSRLCNCLSDGFGDVLFGSLLSSRSSL